MNLSGHALDLTEPELRSSRHCAILGVASVHPFFDGPLPSGLLLRGSLLLGRLLSIILPLQSLVSFLIWLHVSFTEAASSLFFFINSSTRFNMLSFCFDKPLMSSSSSLAFLSFKKALLGRPRFLLGASGSTGSLGLLEALALLLFSWAERQGIGCYLRL